MKAAGMSRPKLGGKELIIADGIAYDDSGQEFEGDTEQTLGSVVEPSSIQPF